MRVHTFIGDSLDPQIGRVIRRIGRPRQDWTSQLLLEGIRRMGTEKFYSMLRDSSADAAARWKRGREVFFKMRLDACVVGLVCQCADRYDCG